jgi:hypothetical protein
MEENHAQEKRPRFTREQIEEILNAQEASGMTQREFCRERGLSLANFGYWRKRHRKASVAEGGGFCEVRLKDTDPGQSTVIRLHDGTEMFLPGMVSPVRLAEYVRALRASC